LFRVLILDISLPGIDGYEVLRRLRLVDPDVPVIAFTALADPHFRARAIQAGFSDIQSKPVQDMSAFCQRVISLARESNFP